MSTIATSSSSRRPRCRHGPAPRHGERRRLSPDRGRGQVIATTSRPAFRYAGRWATSTIEPAPMMPIGRRCSGGIVRSHAAAMRANRASIVLSPAHRSVTRSMHPRARRMSSERWPRSRAQRRRSSRFAEVRLRVEKVVERLEACDETRIECSDDRVSEPDPRVARDGTHLIDEVVGPRPSDLGCETDRSPPRP